MAEGLSNMSLKELRGVESKLEKAISKIRSKKVSLPSKYLILFVMDFCIFNTDNIILFYFFLKILNSLRMSSCLLKLSTCRKGYVLS
jgi:hypothetical protein